MAATAHRPAAMGPKDSPCATLANGLAVANAAAARATRASSDGGLGVRTPIERIGRVPYDASLEGRTFANQVATFASDRALGAPRSSPK
jgi:hypothetical protein